MSHKFCLYPQTASAQCHHVLCGGEFVCFFGGRKNLSEIYLFFLRNRAAKHESLGLLVRNAIRGEAGGCGEGGMGVGGLCGGWLGVENLGWKKSLPQDLWNSLDV